MPEIALSINGRNYRVTCGPGEEARLRTLAEAFDQRITALVRSVGQAGEAQLLLVAALLMADELDEARTELSKLRGAAASAAAAGQSEQQAAGAIDALAQRIEAIAEQLERA